MRLHRLHESPQDPDTLRDAGRTAMTRRALSAPARWLEANGLLSGRICDFGSGKGSDSQALVEQGYDVVSYDPVHVPTDMPDGAFDTVMCNYVLNVVDPDTEAEIIETISGLLSPAGVAYLTVRNDVAHRGVEGSKTGSGTYQRDVHLSDLPVVSGTPGFRMFLLGGDTVDWTGWEDV